MADLRNDAVKLTLTGQGLVEELNRDNDDRARLRARTLAKQAAEMASRIASELEVVEPARAGRTRP